MKHFFLLFVLCSAAVFAQQPIYKITYEKFSHGKPSGETGTTVIVNPNSSWSVANSVYQKTYSYPYEETVTDTKAKRFYQIGHTSSEKQVATIDSINWNKTNFELLADRKVILGMECKLAKTVINSNTIEIWYNDGLGLKGGPSILGQQLGLVLETIRNGNYIVRATKSEKLKKLPEHFPKIPSTVIDGLSYRDAIWKSRFTTISLFDKDQINFDSKQEAPKNRVRLQDGHTLLTKIKLPIIEKGSQVFVDLTEISKGDAYDRTGLLYFFPISENDKIYETLQSGNTSLENLNQLGTPIELIHFITPFGVGQYNYLEQKNKVWQDSVSYRQEITDLLPLLSGKEIVVGLTIGNYDKGGHEVSANITIHKNDGIWQTKSNNALSIFNTNWQSPEAEKLNEILRSDKGMTTKFELKKPMKNVQLRFITTGHGGWENGDEFVPKKNTILLNGKNVFAFTPWRTDCGSYRLSNPASGNFPNGLSSSDYSRANWCPGVTTNPIWIDLGDLDAGTHEIGIKIDAGKPEGGSFSFWSLSGVIQGEE